MGVSKNQMNSVNAMNTEEIWLVITPHAQRERGKVIGRGVHIYIYSVYNYIYIYYIGA